MDGRDVDRAVRDIVRPVLQRAGFGGFTGRAAWRTHDQTVDLVVFRSFTRYLADVMGCTTFSFAVTAGVYYRCLSEQDILRPKDYQLTFRFELGKSLRQPFFHPMTDRPDVWYVRPDGSNLVECVRDARDALVATGLALVDRFTVAEHAFAALLRKTSTPTAYGTPGITMPGNPDSPTWRDTALAIGHLVTPDPRAHMRTAAVLAR